MGKRRVNVVSIILAAVIIIMVVVLFTGLKSSGSSVRLLGSETSTDGSWSVKHFYLVGTEERTINIGESGVLRVDVTTSGGEITMELLDESGKVLLTQENMETTSLELTNIRSGPLTVRFKAVRHRGSFKLTW